MSDSSGDFNPLKEALGKYLNAWYVGLYGDTPSVKEYLARGFARSVLWAPGRMVDSVEEMIKAYQRNSNGDKGANSLMPVVFIALAKDYTPTPGDMGGKQVPRELVQIEQGGSYYGYRQAMMDKRVQFAIVTADTPSADSLAAQLGWYLGQVANRRFYASHTWGQYTFDMPVVIETPDVTFSKIDTDSKNLTILVCDVVLRGTIPYLDAPGEGEDNDGSTNTPPGYPVTQQITLVQPAAGTAEITPTATAWNGDA